jgi:phosphatidylinositol alpha-mannosyltransferase
MRLQLNNKSSLHRVIQLVGLIITIILVFLALHHIHMRQALSEIAHSNRPLLLLALLVMASSMIVRAISWHLILKKAFKDKIPFNITFNAIAVGVFLSATSPLRLGEAARALVVTRHTKNPIKNLPKVAGAIFSQTLMNILALTILGLSLIIVASTHLDLRTLRDGLLTTAVLIVIAAAGIIVARRQNRLTFLREGVIHFISGFRIFKSPLALVGSTFIQLLAWAIQATSCYLLLLALHIHSPNNVYAAAAVLFAVNVTAVVPITPSNIGPFQAACVAVLAGLFNVSTSRAIAYGILLQLVEIVTSIGLGLFALHQEGTTRKLLIIESRTTKLDKPT